MKLLKKFKGLSSGVKASIALFISSLITKGLSYLTTPIYTRLLSTEQYGQVSIFLTWYQIFGTIAMFCLMNGVFNNGLLENPENRDEYSFSILILSNVITLCFSVVLLSLYPLIKSIIKIDLPFIILMVVLWLVQPAYNFWTARQRYEYKYKAVFIISILCAFLSPCVAIVLMLTVKDVDKLYLRIFGAEVVLVLIYLGFYIYLGVKNKFKVKVSYWKSAFLFNLPLIPHYLSTYLLSSSDKIMISHLIGDSATAFYDVGYTVAQIAMVVWTAINASLVPYTYEKCKEGKFDDINKVTIPLLVVFAIGSLLVIILGPEIVMFMATSEYREAIYVIPPIIAGVFFQVQYYIYANVVFYYKRPIYIMIGSVVSVIINIGLNYIFIKKFGYIAAAYTTILCYAIQAIIDYIAMRKIAKRNIYNMKLVIALSITVVAVSLLSLGLYYLSPFIRYAVILVLFLLGIIFRKKLMKIFLQVRKGSKKEIKEEIMEDNNENIEGNDEIIEDNNKIKEDSDEIIVVDKEIVEENDVSDSD